MTRFAPKRILCAVDLSEASGPVLRWAGLFAHSFASELEVLYADWWEPPRYFTEAQIRLLTEQARAHHETVLEQLSHLAKRTLGSDSTHSIEVIDGYPASTILERARTRQADLIVMGSHGRTGLARFRLGSVAEDVVQQSASPTLIVKHEGEPEQPPAIRQVLCPVNFTELSQRCVEVSSAVAAMFGARLTVVHAVEGPIADESHSENVYQQLCSWVPGKVRTQCDVSEVVRRGDAAEQVVRLAAEQNADLIVIGAEHRPFLELTTLGTTTDKVMRHSRVSVLVMPRH
ncbi:MAG: universal stress protein [Acidobacteria bacterium]|nr:universal stress protein [Acidobacteriota bacterium]